jgi:hypothetical protein
MYYALFKNDIYLLDVYASSDLDVEEKRDKFADFIIEMTGEGLTTERKAETEFTFYSLRGWEFTFVKQ